MCCNHFERSEGIKNKTLKNNIHIFYIKQEYKIADDIFQHLLLQLPISFQEEILKYKFWQSAQQSLLGKIILQFGFHKLNLNYTLDDIQISPKERPFLNEIIDFNISHSRDYIICVIAENSKVGIDIEKHRTLKTNIADRYFDKNECNEIDVAEDASKTFFDLWTLKESAIKCDGRGVEVLSKTHKQYQSENKNTVICDGELFHYKKLEIAEKYSCCVCSDKSFEITIQELNQNDFLNTIIN